MKKKHRKHSKRSPRAHAPKRARRKARRAPAAAPGPAIVVQKIGTAAAIELVRDHDGKTWRHQFSVNAKVYRTRDGRQLIISPVRVSTNGTIEG